MKDPFVSIIVPVYNGEKYLSECLDSILLQTYENFELIVVNDGSTDDTGKILEDYARKDCRIHVISQENVGLSGARNKGLDFCIGDYITMIDSDDCIAENYLEVLLALALETHSDIVVAESARKQARLGLNGESYIMLESNDFVAQVLYKKRSDNSACGRLYARNLWSDLRFSNLYYEDLEIFPKITLKANRITYTKAKLYYYRTNEEGITGHFSEKKLDVLKAVDSVIETISANEGNDYLYRAGLCRKLSANFNIFLITAGHKDYRALNEKCWKTIVEMRRSFLFDSTVIPKIRAGIISSYFGRPFLVMLNKYFNISR